MALQATVNDGALAVQETLIKSQNIQPNSRWCLKKGDLKITVSHHNTYLSGNWSDPGCNAGEVQINKK